MVHISASFLSDATSLTTINPHIFIMVGTISISSEMTLHRPRILCLHGGGTNERIFRAQCRALEKALKPYFRFCYAQAPFRSNPGPDVTSVYESFGPFRAWLDPGQDSQFLSKEVEISIRKAIAADNMRGATGDFVGLLGFSQGARVCASLLRAQQISNAQSDVRVLPKWKFAMLLAGRGPLLMTASEATKGANFRHMVRSPSQDSFEEQPQSLLKAPTIHVHGLQDPGLELHRRLLVENFDPRCARVVEWDGAHRVPIRSRDVAALVGNLLPVAKRAGVIVESVRY